LLRFRDEESGAQGNRSHGACDGIARNAGSPTCPTFDGWMDATYLTGEGKPCAHMKESQGEKRSAYDRREDRAEYKLLSTLDCSEGQTIVQDAIRLIIGRRTKEHLNAVLFGATFFGEVSGQLLLSLQSRHDIAS
jgi:hypothetical protein